MNKYMKEKTFIIGLAFVMGIAMWFVNAILESFVYEKSFLGSLIYVQSDAMMLRRLLILSILLFIGVLVILFIRRRKKAESELMMFKKAVETSGEVVFLTDTKGIIRYINPEFTKVYGHSTEEVVNKHTPRILKSGVMKDDDYKYFWKRITEGEVIRGEFINKKKSGDFLNIEGSANPIFDDKGKLVGFLAIQRDISERKMVEKRLLESERVSRALLNAPKDPVYLLDVEGVILSMNEAGLQKIGKTADKLIGSKIYDFANKSKLFDKKEQVDYVLKNCTAFNYEMKDKDDFYESTIYPLFGVDGGVARVAVFERNITKLKKVEQEIKERNKFLKDVIEALPHPFYVIDVKDYSIVLANSASKFSEDLASKKCYKITHDIDAPCSGTEHICPIRKVIESKKPFVTQHIHYDNNNQPRDIEVYGYPILDDNGEVVQMIEYSLDITERKNVEQYLQKLKAEEKDNNVNDSN